VDSHTYEPYERMRIRMRHEAPIYVLDESECSYAHE